MPEIRVVRGGTRSAPRPANNESPYELALLRLQFLTAAPNLERAQQPGWPEEYVTAAVRQLAISDVELKLLRTAASSFARGAHDPFAVAPSIVPRERQESMAALLADYERLNASMPEFVATVLDELRTRFHMTAVYTAPWTTDPQQRPEPAAGAFDTIRDPPRDAGGADATNQRKLGALDDIFD